MEDIKMNFQILVDSCVDFNNALFDKLGHLERIPFKVIINGEEFVDEKSRVLDRLNKLKFQAEEIRTACPSPGDFYASLAEAKDAFVVTISAQLSGSYQAAVAAKDMILEKYPLRNIHVFDSKSASAGESLVALKIQQLLAENQTASHIIEATNAYIARMKTLFSPESLDTLVSNGRVSIAKKLTCKALGLFPIMGDNGEGRIELKGIARGRKNTIAKLIELIGESGVDFSDQIMAITHINALERAIEMKEKVMARFNFKDVVVLEGSGLSSVYASNGGIVVAF